MWIRCRKEGRADFHVGDLVEIPDNVSAFDYTYFDVAPDTEEDKARKARESSDLEDLAKLAREVAEIEASGNIDSAEPAVEE